MIRWAIHRVDDSFEELKKLPDGCVDVVLTDPPYSEHVQSNMSSGTAMKRQVEGGKGGGIPRIELPFEALSGYEFAIDLVRMAKRWAISFCAFEDFGLYRAAVGSDAWVRSGCWLKPNAMGQLTGDRPATAYEGLAIMHRAGKKQWNGRGSYGYWICNGTRGEKDRHPNQKPLNLCLELVAKFTNRGETVLDPFAGSGRIGEACLMLGRNYVGMERDEEWVEKSRARLANVSVESVKDEDCMRLCALPKREKVK